MQSSLHALRQIARALRLCTCIAAPERLRPTEARKVSALASLSKVRVRALVLFKVQYNTMRARTRTFCSSLRERSPCVPHVRLRRSAAIHRCSYTQTQRPYSARTAPVLSASRRVAKTARSGFLGVHGHCVVSRTKPAVHVHTNPLLKLARAFSPCVPQSV